MRSLRDRPHAPGGGGLTATRRVSVRCDGFDAYCGRVEWCPPGFTGEGSDGLFGKPVELGGPDWMERWRTYFHNRLVSDPVFCQRVEALRGKRLGCWCHAHKPCHVDVIVEYLEDDGLDDTEVLRRMAERMVGR